MPPHCVGPPAVTITPPPPPSPGGQPSPQVWMPPHCVGPPTVTAATPSTIVPGPTTPHCGPPETPPQTMATQVLRLQCEAPPQVRTPQVRTPPHCVCPPPQVMSRQVAPQVWMPPHCVGPPQVIWQVTAQV